MPHTRIDSWVAAEIVSAVNLGLRNLPSMPIFISYSRADSDFATKLALQLIKHKATVWIDQWELHVGDSLVQRIQDAIQGTSGLLVILSKASVESEWCRKELSSGLIRELEEKAGRRTSRPYKGLRDPLIPSRKALRCLRADRNGMETKSSSGCARSAGDRCGPAIALDDNALPFPLLFGRNSETSARGKRRRRRRRIRIAHRLPPT
jgi:hypothetical protein